MRTIMIFFLTFLAAACAFAQEKTTVAESAGASPLPPDPAFFLLHTSDIFLPGVRDYDRLLRTQEGNIALVNRLQLMKLSEEIRRDASDRQLRDLLLARFNFSLQFGDMQDEASIWQHLGVLFLGEVVQFAYTYARERVRKQSVTEFDYLYLPAGPGVIRTFGEASESALMRGEFQTWSVWQDFYYEYRNKPCLPAPKNNP
jgi:hypothetical protein